MSDLNELFAELKAEIDSMRTLREQGRIDRAMTRLYEIDSLVYNGEFARAEQDAVS